MKYLLLLAFLFQASEISSVGDINPVSAGNVGTSWEILDSCTYINATGDPSTLVATEEIKKTCPIPAGLLTRDNISKLRITLKAFRGAGAGADSMRIRFGTSGEGLAGTTCALVNGSTVSIKLVAICEVTRLTSSTQWVSSNTQNYGTAVVSPTQNPDTVDMSVATEIVASLNTAVAGDASITEFTVEHRR